MVRLENDCERLNIANEIFGFWLMRITRQKNISNACYEIA